MKTFGDGGVRLFVFFRGAGLGRVDAALIWFPSVSCPPGDSGEDSICVTWYTLYTLIMVLFVYKGKLGSTLEC